MIKRVYVWEFPVRLAHWLTFLSIVVLSLTGIYIGSPFVHTAGRVPLMSWVRFTHLLAGYVFTLCLAVRIYWFGAGNRYAGIREFLPLSSQRWKHMWGTFKFYVFASDSMPHAAGHASIAGASYSLLFVLYFVEVFTGFALRGVGDGVRQSAFSRIMGGWLLDYFSIGGLRLTHHLIMWVVVVFFIAHMYFGWQADLVERQGSMSSIFSGNKWLEEEDE